jgi:phospholipid/cholesterol/gamma-HCH transport system permease protein
LVNPSHRVSADMNPDLLMQDDAGRLTLRASGAWTMQHGRALETLVSLVPPRAGGTISLDLKDISAFDTLGALVIARLRTTLEMSGSKVSLGGVSPLQQALLAEVNQKPVAGTVQRHFAITDLAVDVGRGVVQFGRDILGGIAFLGGLIAALGRLIAKPGRFRWPALVKQVEAFGFRSVPIICLISFLVGGIIAQQSVFQLRTFGTTAFVADLLGVLVLRELGLLLTAIMIAGRSGSAITAEIGSMKMREEIDALRTMGLDPMEVLILPRVLALVICLPILTFLASMAGLLGGGLVAWVYGDVSPDVFLSRLQNSIGLNTFMVGMYKAPVMALVIGIIASIEGMAVKGSAESLGQQTTASVVKAIFMVIVVDGLFAMFFASINY